MAKPGGLADCTVPNWYSFLDNDKRPQISENYWKNHVGFITKCWRNEEKACGNDHILVGKMEQTSIGAGRRIESNFHKTTAHNETTYSGTKVCPATSGHSSCGLGAFLDRYICEKKLSKFSDDWKRCCSSNTKYSPKDGCIPFLYKDGNKYSKECTDICLGKGFTNKGTNEDKFKDIKMKDTLSNEYNTDNNQICNDILTNTDNIDLSTLRQFCTSDIAYKDGKPNLEYSDICGCFYPEGYYNALIKELKGKFPDVPEAYFNDKSCFSTLCTRSPLKKHIQDSSCPAQNFLTCINSVEFNASSINVEGELKFEQDNDCNINSEELNLPYCGKNCSSNDDCPDSCPCNNNICKNNDSVECNGNYTCTGDEKIMRDNALCSGIKNTCNDDSCCIKLESLPNSPNSPNSPPGSPDSDDSKLYKFIKDNYIWFIVGFIGFILFIILIVLLNRNKNIS